MIETLIEHAVRSTLIAAGVAVTLAICRVRSVSLRHAAWTCVLAAMLTLPALSLIVPPVAVPVPLGETLPDVVAHRFQERRVIPSAAGEPASSTPSTPIIDSRAPAGVSPASSSSALPGAPVLSRAPASQSSAWDWRLAFAATYGAGVLVLFARFCLGWVLATRIVRRSRKVDVNSLPPAVTSLARALRICESEHVVVPATVGALRPRVILPADWSRWPIHRLHAVLAHEQAHIRRADPLVATVARVNRIVFWMHPLAWWLERTLTDLAEHASDEAAVRQVGRPDLYASTLIGMARTLRASGRRVLWAATGIAPRSLDARVNRVLANASSSASRLHMGLVASGCLVAVVAGVACRTQAVGLTFDRADDAMEQRDRRLLDALSAESDRQGRAVSRYLSVQTPTAAEIQTLEASADNDSNLEALEPLLVAYWIDGSQRSIEKRRARILELIHRHPDSALAGTVPARIFRQHLREVVRFSWQPQGQRIIVFAGDPDGFEEARRAWLAHADRDDAGPAILGNAASFFETSEPQLSERFLLKALAADPEGPWRIRLGALYASVLAGSQAVVGGRYRSLRDAESRQGFNAVVRRTLGVSKDEILLTATGWFIEHQYGIRASDDPLHDWAADCYRRAILINPNVVLAHSRLLYVRERRGTMARLRGNALWTPPLAEEYEAFAALPEEERFEGVAVSALGAIRSLQDYLRKNEPNYRDHVRISRENARRYADEALRLAARYRNHPEYGTAIHAANMTLGSLALIDGDRAAAIKYLREASKVPASETLAYGRDVAFGRSTWRLPQELLNLGEVEAVADYFDRMARINLARRTDLREAAAKVRRGEKNL